MLIYILLIVSAMNFVWKSGVAGLAAASAAQSDSAIMLASTTSARCD